jgi:predicted tellurium resistance membrane protein TerC
VLAVLAMAIVTMAIVTKGITMAIVTMALAAQVLPRFKTRHCLAYLLLCAMTASLGL